MRVFRIPGVFKVVTLSASCRRYVLVFAAVMCLCYEGCGISTWTELNPSAKGQELTLFKRYNIYLSLGNGVGLSADFFPPIRSTASLDSIPVMTIDSFFFRGSCLSRAWGGPAISYYQYFLDRYRKGLGSYVEMHYNPDIDSSFGWYHPDGFLLLPQEVDLTELCDNQEITATIYARLNDRKTTALIAVDSVFGRYIVKRNSAFRIKFMH